MEDLCAKVAGIKVGEDEEDEEGSETKKESGTDEARIINDV